MNHDFSAFPLLVLCGGRSRRFGSPKGLAVHNGESLIAIHERLFREAGGESKILVLGHDAAFYTEYLNNKKLAPATDKYPWQIVVNEKPERGAFSSLAIGLNTLLVRADWHGVFVTPVDTIGPSPMVWQTMTTLITAAVAAVKLINANRGGHPVLLSREFCSYLVTLDPERSRLDNCLRDLPTTQIKNLETKESQVLLNINSPAILNKIRWS
jgi:CTP:molybdopterin cytidylyltransferase MocA